jgi:hypothetical protein
VVGAILSLTVWLMDLSWLGRSWKGQSFPTFCALSCRLGTPCVAFGSLLLPLEGKRLLLLSTLLCCGFALLRALLCFFGTLRGSGFAFCFLVQGSLACGFAGSGGGANAGDEVEALAAFDLFADGAGAVQGRGLGAVVVVATEIDFSPIGRHGVAFGMPARLAGSAPTPAAS